MNREKILPSTWIMLIILFVSLISIGYQIVLKNVVVDIFNIRAPWVEATITSTDLSAPQYMDIDWTQQYPFPEESSYSQIKMPDDDETNESGLNKIYSQFESYSTDWFFLRDSCEAASKMFGKMLGMNLIADYGGNLIFTCDDGRFAAEAPYVDTSEFSSNVVSFSKYLDSKGIDFLYVNFPSSVEPDEEDSCIERGFKYYSNKMADEFIHDISIAGVNVLDIRDRMEQQGISWTDSFFKTDHHWLPSCGIWAAGQIAEEIDRILGGETNKEYFDIQNYEIVNYPSSYMGSYGNALSAAYTTKDDIQIYFPKFDTRFIKNVPEYGVSICGSFEEVMYDYTRATSYQMWNHESRVLKTVENLSENVNENKILILTDSFSEVVTPFLYCNYRTVNELDLRKFDGSLENYIEKYQPDMVVIQYSQYMFSSTENKSLFIF